MALWAVLLLEYWKRKNATLAYRWDCSDYEDIEVSEVGWVASGKGHAPLSMAPFQERPRPQFAAMAPMTALNPITGEDEPYFPEKNRIHRMLAGSVVLLMMVRGFCHPVSVLCLCLCLPEPQGLFHSAAPKTLTDLQKAKLWALRMGCACVCTMRGSGRGSPCARHSASFNKGMDSKNNPFGTF